ncbi:LOG family protein [Rhodopila sp.]|jgi:uncharacterized protein (TIGR00730 family)|uniref:LOG family protein n=1 Tax=Rhodopila sp. TaxID=2480087 RepID=UPI002C0942D8|nr:LOG family protein [Rhodopila sp.]HVZ07123.1 LOG family protein [Rhodopila sp.]
MADPPLTAEAMVEAILRHPSYLEAVQDVAFLHEPETRGVRLQLDYLKAELLLRQHDVAHTIVVFGGTRLMEPAVAEQRLAAVEAALAADPDSDELRQDRAIARRRVEKAHFYDVARAFGRLVGAASQCGRNGRILIMTGGGPGAMEAANRGAHDNGCQSIGLNITLPHEQIPNAYLSPELSFSFHYFAIRKLHFVLRARALVVFPGGYGTLDELFEILTLVQTRKLAPLPIILVGEAYWRRVFNADVLVEEGMIDPADAALFSFAETADGIWSDILAWYDRAGTPLLTR